MTAGRGRVALAPLAESRSPAELAVTLRAWLEHNGAWDRTAAHLRVHRNTVRSRIAQAERLLGRDLASMRTRAEPWFALDWMSGDG
ncbi:helix-turn-helix domain-containing protein [Streptomyces sp. NPDC090075]|uniref:helix-turn-helix domain-containing protein n=1 Tax=Streptomyces sp. NPDC090075 TaxID=3365937 RepID=UPI0037FCA37B